MTLTEQPVDQVDVDTVRPALGAYARTSAYARRHRAYERRLSMIDYRARTDALARVTAAAAALTRGRRFDHVVEQLRSLADDLDEIPQPRTGGWPLRRPPEGIE